MTEALVSKAPMKLSPRLNSFHLRTSYPALDLNAILHDLYDRSRGDMVIDDQTWPRPPLSPEEAVWAERLLREGIFPGPRF